MNNHPASCDAFRTDSPRPAARYVVHCGTTPDGTGYYLASAHPEGPETPRQREAHRFTRPEAHAACRRYRRRFPGTQGRVYVAELVKPDRELAVLHEVETALREVLTVVGKARSRRLLEVSGWTVAGKVDGATYWRARQRVDSQ